MYDVYVKEIKIFLKYIIIFLDIKLYIFYDMFIYYKV